MPCIIDGDASIPIARYGRSNIGRMKEVYRRGLGYRYGRMMQAISGVHYNYSFPAHFWPVLAEALQGAQARDQDFISAQYFALLRNYRRHGWLILYLFGNSPAVCAFVPARTRAFAAAADARHALRAVRDFAAHERSRLSQQESGGRAAFR